MGSSPDGVPGPDENSNHILVVPLEFLALKIAGEFDPPTAQSFELYQNANVQSVPDGMNVLAVLPSIPVLDFICNAVELQHFVLPAVAKPAGASVGFVNVPPTLLSISPYVPILST